MDFQPTLQRNLNDLGSVLTSPCPRPGGWVLTQKSKLAALRHMRTALDRWRSLRNAMQLAGMPACAATLRVHSSAASFCWDASKGAEIYLPCTIRAMPRPTRSFRSVDFNFDALVLLHEWGHSLLHPPSDIAWLEHLSGPARIHAHPAFSHVGEYAGWRVFNEMFADAFSAAWMLRLFNRSPAVVSTLRDLRNHRRVVAQSYNTIDFPCYHHTSSVLSEVMRQHWDGPAQDIIPRVVHICCQEFSDWYHKGPLTGEKICQSSQAHLKMLDRDFHHTSLAIRLYGRAWRTIGQSANSHSVYLLGLLAQDQPQHFLFELSCVRDVFPTPPSVELCLE